MVIVEEQHDQETERGSNKDPFDIQKPEIDQPAPWLARLESGSDRDLADARSR